MRVYVYVRDRSLTVRDKPCDGKINLPTNEKYSNQRLMDSTFISCKELEWLHYSVKIILKKPYKMKQFHNKDENIHK